MFAVAVASSRDQVSLLSIATQTLKPSGKLTLSLESQVKGTPIGICVEGASVHKFLVLIDSASFCQLHMEPRVRDLPSDA